MRVAVVRPNTIRPRGGDGGGGRDGARRGGWLGREVRGGGRRRGRGRGFGERVRWGMAWGRCRLRGGRGGSAAIGVEGGEGEAAGGAEGGTGESAGVVVGKEGLNLGGGAAGFSERHSYTKTESGRFGNHGVGLALTVLRPPRWRRPDLRSPIGWLLCWPHRNEVHTVFIRFTPMLAGSPRSPSPRPSRGSGRPDRTVCIIQVTYKSRPHCCYSRDVTWQSS
jgi:hypothetical protein